MNTNQIQRKSAQTLAALSLLAVLSSCGHSKQSVGTGSSVTNNLAQGASVAKCSIDMSNKSDFGMKLQAYESSSHGVRSDLIRIQFIRFPSDFSNSDASAVQLWTRTIDTAGNWGSWHNVRFYIEFRRRDGQILTSPHAYQDITWKDLKLVASSFGLDSSDARSFFSQIQLVAQLDINNDAKIITAALYQGGQQQATNSITALAPIFDANPKTYQQSKPQALYDLHPLQSLTNSNFTNSQYEFEINKFCF